MNKKPHGPFSKWMYCEEKEIGKYVIFHIWGDQSDVLAAGGFIIVFSYFKNQCLKSFTYFSGMGVGKV